MNSGQPENWDELDFEAREEIERLWRWCIYCQADCWADEIEHRDDCATNTGLYPVRGPDLGPLAHCPECSHEWRLYGMRCMDCGCEFKEGDITARRWIESDVCEVVCVGCAALTVTQSREDLQ